MTRVLEHQYLIVQVYGRVVHGCGGDEHHLLLIAWYLARDHARHLAYLLQLLEGASGVVAEFVGFIYKHEVILVCIPIVIVLVVKHFRETAIGDEASVFVYAEVLEGGLPVLLYGWRKDNEYLGVVSAIFYEEFLGYHSGNDRLAQTYDIGKEEAVVSYEFLIAFYDGICLIFELVIPLWHIEGVVLVNLQHSV